MHLSIVAMGSRGDVQPYLALGLGLQRAGYQVRFCADRLFEQLVTFSGLPFVPVTAVPMSMMQPNLSRIGEPVKLMGWLERHLKPPARQFLADQPIWGRRLNQLGAGLPPIPFFRLSVENLALAIDQAVNDPTIRRNEAILGEKLEREDGVGRAVDFIQAYLENK